MSPKLLNLSSRFLFRSLGYAVFALVCLLVFAVLFFPYHSLELRIEQELSDNTGLAANIHNLHYGFPLGLAFDSLSITPRNAENTAAIRIDQGSLTLNPFPLAVNRLKARLQGQVLDGSIRVRTTARASAPHLPARLETAWESVDISQLSEHLALVPAISDLQGKLSGHSSLTVDGPQISSLEGSGVVELDQAAAELDLPGVDAVKLENVAGKAHWKLQQGELRINRCDLQSRGVQGGIHGSVGLHPQLDRSRIDLEGKLTVTQAQPQLYSMVRQYFNSRDIAFTLKGTLSSPAVRTK